MYRACLAVWKRTPHQLEMELIEGCLNGSDEGADEVEAEVSVEEFEEAVRGIGAYCEESRRLNGALPEARRGQRIRLLEQSAAFS